MHPNDYKGMVSATSSMQDTIRQERAISTQLRADLDKALSNTPNDNLTNHVFRVVESILSKYDSNTSRLIERMDEAARAQAEAAWQERTRKHIEDAVAPLYARINSMRNLRMELAEREAAVVIREAEVQAELDAKQRQINAQRVEIEQLKQKLDKASRSEHFFKERVRKIEKNYLLRLLTSHI